MIKRQLKERDLKNRISNASSFKEKRALKKEFKTYHKESMKKADEYLKWEKDNILNGALVSVFYKRVVPKSKRIKTLLSKKSEHSNDSIVGAKFSEDKKHIITHFVDLDTIKIKIEK